MNYQQQTENERYQIYTLKKLEYFQKSIAEILDRSPSTISRELQRNQGLCGYRPKQAQRLSDTRRQESHKAIKVTEEVGWIEILIRQELSPQQVVDYLKIEKKISLHHET
ncbi:MAG: IS30 family transposase, partial [Gammaproteobacteria bacterium]